MPGAASRLRVYHRLQQAARRLGKQADRALLAALDLTTAQAAVLAVVGQEGEATQRAVARQLSQSESAMTSMARRLLERGYLRRVVSPDDGRVWLLTLTRAGERALEQAAGPFGRINERIESALGARELERLADSLDRLAEAFADEDEAGDRGRS